MNDSLQDFIELCKKIERAMLVTVGAGGRLTSRPMIIAQLENNGDLWFATNSESLKVDDILNNSSVCVTLAGNGNYASISGHATIEEDPAKIKELWSEPWRVWFPGGVEDPSLTLVHVHSEFGEYWCNSGTNGVRYAFRAAQAYLTGQRPVIDAASHGRIDL